MSEQNSDDAAEMIVKQLDFEDVKQKKIFQKFLAMKEQQSTNPRARSQDPPSSNYSRMNTIIEEDSQTHTTNISPPNRKSSPTRRPHTVSQYDSQNPHHQYQNNDDDPDEYYQDEPSNQNGSSSKRHGFRNNLLLQTRFSPASSIDNKAIQNKNNRMTPPSHSSSLKRPTSQEQNNHSAQNSQERQPNNRRYQNQNAQNPHQQRQEEDHELVGHSQLIHGDYFNGPPPPPQHMRRDMPPIQQDGRYPAYARDSRWEMGPNGNRGEAQDGYELRHSRENSGKGQQGYVRRPMYDEPSAPPFMRYQMGGDGQYGMPSHPSVDFLMERVRMLTMKCQDQEISLQRMSANFADFKDQTFKDSSAARATILNYENSVVDLQERVFDLQRREDALGQENTKLKQRISQEQMMRTKCEEDLRETQLYLEESKDSIMEAKREGTRREDEIVHLRQQIDSSKQKHMMQVKTLEMNIGQLRDEKEALLREIETVQQQQRGQNEMQDKSAGILAENKRLYNEIDQAKAEILDLNHYLEQQKTDLYTTKHHLIERSQRETHLIQQIEAAHAEIAQLKSLLHRAESSFLKDSDGNGIGMTQSMQQPYTRQQNIRQEREHLRTQPMEQSPPRTKQGQRERIRSQNSPTQQQQSRQMQQQGQRTMPGTNTTTYDFMQSEVQHETPKRSKRNNKPQVVEVGHAAEARMNREENNTISQQLRNKNINTPSNFLSWEVPDQQHPQRQSQQPQYQNHSQQQQQQQQQQMQQYQQQQQQQQQQYQHQAEHQRRNEATNDRHADREYQQIYDSYMRDSQKGQQFENRNQAGAAPQKRGGDPVMTAQEQQRKQAVLNQSIAGIEANLLMLNQEKDRLKSEQQKVEETKLKSGQMIRRKNEIAEELSIIENNISSQKTKLRELNALHI